MLTYLFEWLFNIVRTIASNVTTASGQRLILLANDDNV